MSQDEELNDGRERVIRDNDCLVIKELIITKNTAKVNEGYFEEKGKPTQVYYTSQHEMKP